MAGALVKAPRAPAKKHQNRTPENGSGGHPQFPCPFDGAQGRLRGFAPSALPKLTVIE